MSNVAEEMKPEECPLKKYVGQIHFGVVLRLQLEATSDVEAFKILRDYENLLRSNEWCARQAQKPITHVFESSYISRRDAMQVTEGIRLG